MVLDEFQQAVAAGASVLALSADLLLTGGDLLLSVSDILFSIVAVLQGQLGTEFGLDPTLLRNLLLAAGALYLTNLLFRLYDRLTENS
jgi:hypothetical protein